MTTFRRIAETFGLAATPPQPPDDRPLRDALRHSFGDDLDRTTTRVKEVLEAMGLPLPRRGAVITGSEGALMFLDDYGIILRVELTDDLLRKGERIDDHPMVLQPLGQRKLTEYAVLEICPGVHVTKDKKVRDVLFEKLPQSGVSMWDFQVCNAGVLPIRLPQFPDGVPVVIDRLAVERLSEGTREVKDALSVFGLAQDVQQMAYGALKQSFATAWPQGQDKPDPQAFRDFLQQCIRHKGLGHLVSGWARDPNAGPNDWMYEDTKRSWAADAGYLYAQQIKQPAR